VLYFSTKPALYLAFYPFDDDDDDEDYILTST
jgi:hypothetical protein